MLWSAMVNCAIGRVLELSGQGVLQGALLATWLLLKLELRGSQDLPSFFLSATRLTKPCPRKCPRLLFPLTAAPVLRALGQILCLLPHHSDGKASHDILSPSVLVPEGVFLGHSPCSHTSLHTQALSPPSQHLPASHGLVSHL